MAPPTVDQLADMFDHSIIDAAHTEADMKEGVAVAKKYKAGRFTTQPFRVKQARQLLEGSSITVQTFVGFPHGSDHTEVKVLEAKKALEDGVQELDMVINISALLSGDIKYVEKDVKAVVDTAKPYGVTVKAIIETFYLNDEQVKEAGLAAERAGAAFIKTSTGTKPDQVSDVEHKVGILASVLKKPETIVKASGATGTIQAIIAYYRAGARRFGVVDTAGVLDNYAKLLEADPNPMGIDD